jgi:hypothetical protein
VLPEIRRSWATGHYKRILERGWPGLPPELRNRGIGLRDHQHHE